MYKSNNLKTLLRGSIMGIAEIIPGVSGSTFALIMGIYDDFINLLHSVSQFTKTFVEFILRKKSKLEFIAALKNINFKFGIILGLGMLISIALFSGIMKDSLEKYPQYVAAFFFGLVLASVLIPWREIKKVKPKHYVYAIASFLITFICLGLQAQSANNNPSALLLFIGGVLGISGLILPGISGSFILLLMGLYEYIINIVSGLAHFDIKTKELIDLSFFVTGLLIGFIFFVRILKFGLSKYHSEIMAVLTGLMLGSLRVLYPFFESATSGNHSKVKTLLLPWQIHQSYSRAIIVYLFVIGFFLVLLLARANRAKEELGKV